MIEDKRTTNEVGKTSGRKSSP